MPIEDLRERRLPSTARARAQARTSSGGPPEPGDLFVLQATRDLPVEWAVLDRRPERGEFLAVPADVSPFAGSADVEVPATEPGGPLCLRCRFGAWLGAGLFEPGLRSGTLSPETVAEARQRVRRLEAGTLEPSPLAEETDADSEYRDWLREVPEQARALALAARPAGSRTPRSWAETGYRLAAMFAVLAVGLAFWVAVLRREVDRLSAPTFDISPHEVLLGETHRGATVLEIPAQDSQVLLTLVVDASIPPQGAGFEILDANGHRVWHSGLLRLTPRDFRLFIRRSQLPDGDYRVRIVPETGGRPLSESTLTIQTRR